MFNLVVCFFSGSYISVFFLAIKLNPKYTKALSRRARAYEALDEKRKCLEGLIWLYFIFTKSH